MKKYWLFISFMVIFSVTLSSCNLPGNPTPTSQVDALNTAAAQTVQAQQTNIAQTNEAKSQITPTITPTQGANVSSTSTATPTPSQTTQSECYQASLASETIPDGKNYNPGQAFTKTWTLKNTGSCDWTSNFDVVFVTGDSMDAPASMQLTSGTVKPGESVVVSMDLEAPYAAGTHRGEFKLRNANGVLFGLGSKGSTFWVEIDVEGTLYDFVANYCTSDVAWTSGAGSLGCPGSSGDTEGWVRKANVPKLENGVSENEPGLVMQPEMVTDGWVKGTFPAISITGGVYFRALIGCNSTEACDVKFVLQYKIEGESVKTLATWHEVQDGTYNKVSVDLSSLAGKEVQFILLVEANGSPSNDEALWVAPRIEP